MARRSRPRYRRSRRYYGGCGCRYHGTWNKRERITLAWVSTVALALPTCGLSLLALPLLLLWVELAHRPRQRDLPLHRRSAEWQANYKREMNEQMARLEAEIEAERRG